ncbi:MAG: MFS transporter [Sphingomonadaceae bacterium]
MSAVSDRHESGHSPFQDIVGEWRVNWRPGLASFIGLGLGGSIAAPVFSIFVLPLEQSFGWSRGEISLAFTVTVFGGLCAPFVGRLIDRVGPRWPLLFSFCAMALFYSLLAAMPGHLLVFYGFYAALNFFALPTTSLGYARVLCTSFVKSRGFALAIGRAGVSLGSAILPLVLFAIIADSNWRMGWLFMAALVLCIALPVTWWGVDRKKQSGGEAAERKADREDIQPYLDLLGNRYVLLIAIAAAFAYVGIIAISSQALPVLVDRGISADMAAGLVGFLGLASMAGALTTGFLLDRIWAPAVAALMLICGAAGALMLALFSGDFTLAAIAFLLVGFTFGAETDICSFVIARYCGMTNYSSVYGICIVAITTASAIGSASMGYMFDAMGSYTLPLFLCSGSFAVAALIYLSLGRYPKEGIG